MGKGYKKLHKLLTITLDTCEWSVSFFDQFPLRKSLQYSMGRMGRSLSQCTLGGERKSLSTLEMKLWSSGLHPVTFMTELSWLSHNNDDDQDEHRKMMIMTTTTAAD
jgi:hypothetical protein